MPARLPLTATQDRLFDALLARVEAWASGSPQVSRILKGTIISVTAGGASDGNALVVLSLRGGTATVTAPYLATYTPTVGHVVAVARTSSQLLILGRIVGTP